MISKHLYTGLPFPVLIITAALIQLFAISAFF